ncbi:MAG TPA: efflux RND transporter permease subunit, partial [Spirochaetota bacterium]|nr:efflux RND transporter permease subunit [Spirochaetota bacterium]
TAARLADAACIKKKNKERQNVTLMNGCQNLMLYIHKNAQASLLHTGKKVSRLLSEFKKNSAKKTAAAIIPVFNRYELLQNELNRLYLSLLLGLLILIMLCLFFFRKFYLVLIVIGSISFSVLGTIAGLKLCRISLNIISITALAAASGMTADASLIMLEYLLKANRNKLHKYVQSVMTAFLPITAGILTTIIVFTPVFFLKGNFKQLFTAAAAAVVFSQGLALVYAVYILPVLYRGLNNHSPFCIKLKIPGAAAVNRQIFRYKKYIIFLATLFILIPVFLFLSRSSVINSVNTAEKKIKLRYDFKPGTRLKQMKEKAAAAGNLFKKKVSGIKNIFIKTEKYSSDIIISIKDKKSLTETSTRIKKLIKNFHLSDTDAFLHLQNKDNRLKKNQTVTIEMSGTDYKIIRQKLQQLNKRLYSLPAVKQILFNFRSDFKKIILTPDRSKLARAGVTPAAAASFLQQRGQGFIAAKFTPQSRRHSREDIRVSAEGFYFKDRKLKQVQFPGGNTRLALNSFFKRREANQLSALTRKNKNRYLGITVIGKNKITAADLKNRI